MTKKDLLLCFTFCPFCKTPLEFNPFYRQSGTRFCPKDGDFFVQQYTGQPPLIIFRQFDDTEDREPRRKVPGRTGNPGVILQCNETGKVYSSIKQAARAMGLQTAGISLHLSGKRKKVNGYTFTRLEPDKKD